MRRALCLRNSAWFRRICRYCSMRLKKTVACHRSRERISHHHQSSLRMRQVQIDQFKPFVRSLTFNPSALFRNDAESLPQAMFAVVWREHHRQHLSTAASRVESKFHSRRLTSSHNRNSRRAALGCDDVEWATKWQQPRQWYVKSPTEWNTREIVEW